MLSCKEVVKTVSSEERTTWRRKLEVRIHLMMCWHCGKYVKQLELLKIGIQNLLNSKVKSADKNKIQTVENRVLEKLKK